MIRKIIKVALIASVAFASCEPEHSNSAKIHMIIFDVPAMPDSVFYGNTEHPKLVIKAYDGKSLIGETDSCWNWMDEAVVMTIIDTPLIQYPDLKHSICFKVYNYNTNQSLHDSIGALYWVPANTEATNSGANYRQLVNLASYNQLITITLGVNWK